MTDTLFELAARCEATETGSWQLDHDIAMALGWTTRLVGGVQPYYSPDEPDRMRAGPPKWSRSLDAAMTLKPEGWHLAEFGEGPNLTPRPHDFAYDGTWFAMLHGVASGDLKWGSAATPALALAAAALRALLTERERSNG